MTSLSQGREAMHRGRMLIRSTLTAAVLVLVATHAPAATEPVPVAAFDFELIDTSLEGEIKGTQPAETARLKIISNQLRQLLAKSGRYQILDTTEIKKEIEAAGNLHGCNGCEADLARRLGAKLAIIGQVQKVSNLILNINIYIRDVETGKMLQVMSADIRGNTDDSWRHGVRWLVRNRILSKKSE